MNANMRKLRQAGAITLCASAAAIGSASARDFSVDHSFGAFNVSADGGGVGVSGDLRTSLGVVTNDEGADWLSRVRGGYDYHSDGDSRFWAETIQPFAQSEHSALFWQARISHALDDQTINAGIGYRWLSPDSNWLLGVNAFYDYTVEAGHQRASIGGEALGPHLTFRVNVYEALSGWEDLGGGVREHALGGADASVDAQAPHMPWLRIGARYYQWNGIDGPDAKGLQGTINANITDRLEFVGTYAGEDDPEGDYYLGVRLSLGGDRDRPTATRQFWSQNLLDARDLSDHMLDFVERENRMITESQGGPYASGTITISRSE